LLTNALAAVTPVLEQGLPKHDLATEYDFPVRMLKTEVPREVAY